MHEASPPGTVFALDLSGLNQPDISFFTAWRQSDLVGMGAIKHLSAKHGEIKSMRTGEAHLRTGVGRAMLGHLIALSVTRGYLRVSLETGSGPAFEPALALYKQRGFVQGEPFADYQPSPFNQFFHLNLAAEA